MLVLALLVFLNEPDEAYLKAVDGLPFVVLCLAHASRRKDFITHIER